MDESVRFADILFTALTLLIIYLILYLVNRSRRDKQQPEKAAGEAEMSPDSDTANDIEAKNQSE